MSSGISTILGAISFLGVLLLILGVVIIVVSSSQGRKIQGGIGLAIFGLAIALAFQLISQGVVVVQPTQRAVVFRTLAGELTNPRGPGTHIIIPVFEETILYPVNIESFTMSSGGEAGEGASDDAIVARTRDGQEVRLDITVNYRINDSAEQINGLHRKWFNNQTGRPNYRDGFIRPTVRSLARDATSVYTAAGIYGEQRAALTELLNESIGERFAEEGLVLEDLLLRNVTFSQQFTNAIEQAQVAEQDARRAEIRVREVEQEAQQAIARANGERLSVVERALGEAEAIVIRAESEAEALRLVSEQIAANPALIQYLYVQNLSDNINIALVPSNSPFLFDFESLAEPNTDFAAPEANANMPATPEPETETEEGSSSN